MHHHALREPPHRTEWGIVGQAGQLFITAAAQQQARRHNWEGHPSRGHMAGREEAQHARACTWLQGRTLKAAMVLKMEKRLTLTRTPAAVMSSPWMPVDVSGADPAQSAALCLGYGGISNMPLQRAQSVLSLASWSAAFGARVRDERPDTGGEDLRPRRGTGPNKHQ